MPDTNPHTAGVAEARERLTKRISDAADRGMYRMGYDDIANLKAELRQIAAELSALPVGGEVEPVRMLLFCPSCGLQHVDEPDERTPGWSNPPHRSHLCHGCGHIWRPADVPTEGVREIATRGKNDSPALSQGCGDQGARGGLSVADLDDVAGALAPFAAVSVKAGDKAKDESCWCGQDGAVIRYADLRRAARLYAALVTERIARQAAAEGEAIATALLRSSTPTEAGGHEGGEAPLAPEGWRMVPVEPTRDMLRTGTREHFGGLGDNPSTRGSIAAIYAAMLSAAPTPSRAPTREEIKAKAVEFVSEQSEGEWGDDLIQKDADKLTAWVLRLFAQEGAGA